MKWRFIINGEAKLELRDENSNEEILLNMVFPENGKYIIEKTSDSITIKKEKDEIKPECSNR